MHGLLIITAFATVVGVAGLPIDLNAAVQSNIGATEVEDTSIYIDVPCDLVDDDVQVAISARSEEESDGQATGYPYHAYNQDEVHTSDQPHQPDAPPPQQNASIAAPNGFVTNHAVPPTFVPPTTSYSTKALHRVSVAGGEKESKKAKTPTLEPTEEQQASASGSQQASSGNVRKGSSKHRVTKGN